MKQMDDLIVAYTNEKATRRLLPYNSVVDELSEVAKHAMEDAGEHPIARELHELELERVKYFAKEYLLARLDKLKGSVFLDKALMSAGESAYYDKYLALLGKYGVLSGKESADHEYVGFYCVKSLDYVKIDNEVNEIFEGDFFVASIDDILEYVKKGYITLV